MKFSDLIAICLATTNSYSLILWINKGFHSIIYHEYFIDSAESLMGKFHTFQYGVHYNIPSEKSLSAKMKIIENEK